MFGYSTNRKIRYDGYLIHYKFSAYCIFPLTPRGMPRITASNIYELVHVSLKSMLVLFLLMVSGIQPQIGEDLLQGCPFVVTNFVC